MCEKLEPLPSFNYFRGVKLISIVKINRCELVFTEMTDNALEYQFFHHLVTLLCISSSVNVIFPDYNQQMKGIPTALTQ